MESTNEEVFEDGTEVLVFRYVQGWREQNMDNFVKGRIIKGELSGDLSYHGSPWHVMNYTVLGEDGEKYFGNMRYHTVGDHYFMTREMYIGYLNHKIRNTELRIDVLNGEIDTMQRRIEEIKSMDGPKDPVLSIGSNGAK